MKDLALPLGNGGPRENLGMNVSGFVVSLPDCQRTIGRPDGARESTRDREPLSRVPRRDA